MRGRKKDAVRHPQGKRREMGAANFPQRREMSPEDYLKYAAERGSMSSKLEPNRVCAQVKDGNLPGRGTLA